MMHSIQYYEMTPVEVVSKGEAVIEGIRRKRGKTLNNKEYILTPVRPSFTRLLPASAAKLFSGCSII